MDQRAPIVLPPVRKAIQLLQAIQHLHRMKQVQQRMLQIAQAAILRTLPPIRLMLMQLKSIIMKRLPIKTTQPSLRQTIAEIQLKTPLFLVIMITVI